MTAVLKVAAARAGRLLPWLLAVALVALLAWSAWLWRHDDQPDRSAAAATTGRSAATLFFTLDGDDVDTGIDKLLAMSTGAFRSDYEAQRDELVKQVQTQGVSVTADVPESGTAVEFLDDDRAQVLVAVDTTTTLGDGRSETDNYRVRVQLSLEAGRWLVSGVEQVG